MWTKENRGRYDRSRLRYPSDLTDEEWVLVEPQIASAKRGGNKRTVDVREMVNGLMYVLSSGCHRRTNARRNRALEAGATWTTSATSQPSICAGRKTSACGNPMRRKHGVLPIVKQLFSRMSSSWLFATVFATSRRCQGSISQHGISHSARNLRCAMLLVHQRKRHQ